MGKVNLLGDRNMEELVITPGGARPKSQVHLIEAGYHIDIRGGVVYKVNTSTRTIAKDLGKINSGKEENFINRNILRSPIQELTRKATSGSAPSPITDRWIVYSGWRNNSGHPITYFNTSWIVPPPPATDNGQLIYLFNGIENAAFDIILQPVLQWGSSPAGGGSFWAVTNWFVGSPGSGIALHRPLVPVNPGDVIQGLITLQGRSGSNFSYLSSFRNFPLCDLFVPNIDELTWANETLECYRLRQFSDYPNTMFTAMSDIDIRLDAIDIQLQWESFNAVTDNGQHCSIVSNASPNGRVDLFYSQQNV